MAIVPDLSGNRPLNAPVTDPHYEGGNEGPLVISLANNITLAAGATTTPVNNVTKMNAAILSISGTFNGSTLKLQSLDPAGSTWNDVTTGITAPGTVQNSYYIGENSSLRLINSGGASITGLYATLS